MKTQYSPWGPVQDVETIGPGIQFVSTASHGGYKLDAERLERVQAKFPGFTTFCGLPQYFEEDCDWCVVHLTFPMLFESTQNAAKSMLLWLREHASNRVSESHVAQYR